MGSEAPKAEQTAAGGHTKDAPRAACLILLPRKRLVHPFHLLFLASVSVVTLAWAGGVLGGARWDAPAEYLLLLNVYGFVSASFLLWRVKRGRFRLFDIPVFVTFLGFVEFGLAPLVTFIDPGVDLLHGDRWPLIRALLCFMLGMTALWVGSEVLPARRLAGSFGGLDSTDGKPTRARTGTLIRGSSLFVIGVLAKIYLVQSDLYSYTQSQNAFFSNLDILQILWTAADFGTCALLVVTIERFRYPFEAGRRILFWTILLLECMWGLISGMKYLLLRNFVLVALVSSYVEGRVRKAWLAAPVLLLIAIYPFSEHYRSLVRTNVRVNSLASAQDASRLALGESLRDESDLIGWVETGSQRAIHRVNLSESMSTVMALGQRAQRLKGDERWWMIPIYPFVPRFLWTKKPFLNKGQRFSILLNLGSQTSTALTYPGDLYVEFGLPGIVLGMFLLGLAGQWLANRVSGPSADRHLLVYAATFMVAADLENDAFLLWVSVIKTIIIMTLVAWLIYGLSPNSAVTLFLKRISGRRPCEC
jgi:hypothetical protein